MCVQTCAIAIKPIRYSVSQILYIYMENKYTKFIQDEQDKFLRPQKNLLFSDDLLVPSSSKYVTAALVYHWFKKSGM